MAEAVETQAAPSPAVFEAPKAGTPEYVTWRSTGELPEAKPKADPAPAHISDAADPDPAPQTQEHKEQASKPKPKPTAEERIAQLESTIEKIRKGAGIETRKAESSPAAAKPAQQPQQPAPTRPKPTVDGKGPDGKPYASYEDFVEDLSDWKSEQRQAQQQREQQQQAAMAETSKKLESARSLYGKDKADEVIFPTNQAIVNDQAIPLAVKALLGESEVFPHLLFNIGSDPDDLAAFIQMARTTPGKAMRYIAKVESLIEEELAGDVPRETTTTGRDADGKFTSAKEPNAPAKRGPESTPAPPLEVGGRGAGPMDESARALSQLKDGDSRAFRDYMRAENAKESRRRRGV